MIPPVGRRIVMAPNAYRIEKDRVPVVVTTNDGDQFRGEIFVQASARQPFGMEDAPECLNAPEPFFALRVGDGGTLLVAKDRLRHVVVAREDCNMETWQLMIPAEAEVHVAGGEYVVGQLMIEPAEGRSRTIDYLNRNGERFIGVHTDEAVVLIHRLAISYVRPLG